MKTDVHTLSIVVPSVNPLDPVRPRFVQETDEHARVNHREGHLACPVVIEVQKFTKCY